MGLVQKYIDAVQNKPIKIPHSDYFDDFLQKFSISKDDVDTKTYQALLLITLYAAVNENSSMDTFDMFRLARSNAFALTVVFGSETPAINYLKQFEAHHPKDKQPVHNACLFSLPKGDIHLWRSLVKHNKPNGPSDKLMRLLGLADKIEEYVKDHRPELEREIADKVLARFHQKFPLLSDAELLAKKQVQSEIRSKADALLSSKTPIDTLMHYVESNCYKRAGENPEAAIIFFERSVSEQSFHEYLSLKPVDNNDMIPPVCIDGNDINVDYQQYCIKKLSPFDPRAAILGRYTNCCQSLGENGSAPAIHGITNERGGFYVICDKVTDKIVAQCWAWRSEDGRLVFDSIETQAKFRIKNELLVINMFTKLAETLVEHHHVSSVLVGVGGATPKKMGKLLELQVASLNDDVEYGDSTQQRLVANSVFPLNTFTGIEMNLSKDEIMRFIACYVTPKVNVWDYLTQNTVAKAGLSVAEVEQQVALVNEWDKLPDKHHSEEYNLLRMQLILQAGIFPDRKASRYARTAIKRAVYCGFIAVIKLLLEHGASNRDNALLYAALHAENLRLSKWLIVHGLADANFFLDESLKLGIFRLTPSLLSFLVAHGADVNAFISEKNTTPAIFLAKDLYYDAELGDKTKWDEVRYLIESGTNINTQEDTGNTVLHYAALTADTLPFVKWLIAHGADPAIKNKDGKTAEELAHKNKDVKSYLQQVRQKKHFLTAKHVGLFKKPHDKFKYAANRGDFNRPRVTKR